MTFFDRCRDLIFCIVLFLFLPFPAGNSVNLPKEHLLTREVDLADWGLEVPEDVEYLSIGILHKNSGDELLVYDVRKEKPVIEQPSRPQSRIPPIRDGVFLLDDFHRGMPNRLGGYFSSIIRSPSQAHVTIDRAGEGRRALCFAYDQKSPGFAGFWIHLFDLKKPPVQRIFLDATPFRYITFSIKGEEGNEGLVLQAADYSWERKEDSLEIGDVDAFLPSGKIQKSWQRAWVPLEELPEGIERKEMASLVFLARQGMGKVYIGDIAFTEEKKATFPRPVERKAQRLSFSRGMWLWNTKDLLGNEEEQMRLVHFCGKRDISEIFLQVPYEMKKAKGSQQILWDMPRMASLLSLLHRNGIKVHALDGDPRYALRQWHPHVLAVIESVIRYNENVSPAERFQAIRLDNEPYILPEFAGVQKASIIEQYMELLSLSRDLTRSAGLELGVDIPFWFDQKNEFFEPIARFRDRPLTRCVLDIVDNIGVMDYRTTAYGADGVIAHALDELRYASEKGKRVFIGLETAALPDETLLAFGRGKGPSSIKLKKLKGSRILLQWIPKGIETGSDADAYLIQQNRVLVPAGKITFAGRALADLTGVMQKAEYEFQRYPGFYGFAIHHYESFRALEDKGK